MSMDPHIPPPVPLQYSTAALKPRRAGKGFMAVCGTFVAWGLGHLLCGRSRRAAGWFIVWVLVSGGALVCLLVPRMVAGLVVLLPLQILLFLVAAVDTFVTGRNSERVWVSRAWQRYLVGIALLGVAWLLSYVLRVDVLLPRVEAFVLPSKSMMPTLGPGDRILVHKRLTPHRWDLVVFRPPTPERAPFVMRLVGLPGEKVEIVAGKVQINDAAVNPPAAVPVYQGKVRFGNNGCEGHPITLGPDEYYMLGDNTAVAYDSRWWDTAVPGHQPGAVPAGDVIGVATTVYWPPQHWRTLPQN